MIVIQALAVAVALTLLLAMALGPEIQDWHERTPVQHDRPDAAPHGSHIFARHASQPTAGR